jgi:hypothetical protein
VEKNMAKQRHWEDKNYIINSIRQMGNWAHGLWFLTIIFAVIGAISDLINADIGLTSMSWFLLALVFGLLSIPFYIGIAMAWNLKSLEK